MRGYVDTSNAPQPFAEQRQKWERWIAERRTAGNLDEPLLVYVDDEEEQRSNRYYEARLQKFPGRNILLFENAAEAVEFLKFAKEKQLHVASVISDYDNGKVSSTTGTEVMQAAIDYNQGREHNVVKLVISSFDRTPKVDELNQQNNAIPAAQDDAAVQKEKTLKRAAFLHKDEGHYIQRALDPIPNKQKEELEHVALIPDLIYSMNITTTLMGRFRDVLRPYHAEIPPGQTDDPPKTIKRIYSETREVLKKSARRMEDFIKLWALVKDYEIKAEKASGLVSPNPTSLEPEEPINVRILGTFLLQELKGIQKNINSCMGDLLFLNFVPVADIIMADESLSLDERGIKADHVLHNLKTPMMTIRTEINKLAGTTDKPGIIETFLNNATTNNVLTEPAKPGEHRFDHAKLLEMVDIYQKAVKKPKNNPLRFFYVPASKSQPDLELQATRDRTENTPGAKAPVRKTIEVPHTDEELRRYDDATQDPVKPIKKGFLDRFRQIVETDRKIWQQLTATGADRGELPNLAQLANMLKAELNSRAGGSGPAQ